VNRWQYYSSQRCIAVGIYGSLRQDDLFELCRKKFKVVWAKFSTLGYAVLLDKTATAWHEDSHF
jgi:hypothetical protein